MAASDRWGLNRLGVSRREERLLDGVLKLNQHKPDVLSIGKFNYTESKDLSLLVMLQQQLMVMLRGQDDSCEVCPLLLLGSKSSMIS